MKRPQCCSATAQPGRSWEPAILDLPSVEAWVGTTARNLGATESWKPQLHLHSGHTQSLLCGPSCTAPSPPTCTSEQDQALPLCPCPQPLPPLSEAFTVCENQSPFWVNDSMTARAQILLAWRHLRHAKARLSSLHLPCPVSARAKPSAEEVPRVHNSSAWPSLQPRDLSRTTRKTACLILAWQILCFVSWAERRRT